MDLWLSFGIAVLTCVNLILSGRAARGMAVTRRAVHGLVSVIGRPKDRIVATTLIEDVSALTSEVGTLQDQLSWLKDRYKTDFDNLRSQQILDRLERAHRDESPVRSGGADAPEAWPH